MKTSNYHSKRVEDGCAVFGRNISIGMAVIPWCQKRSCWVLPVGANQGTPEVRVKDLALQFARNLNQIMIGARQ